MKTYFQQLYDYNRWANVLFADALKKSAYENEKIDALYAHIAAAQMIWLSRMTEITERVPGVFEPMPYEESARLIDYSNRKFIELIEGCEDFEQAVTYKTSKGQAHTNPLNGLLVHVANHSTHHRGQIALLLRAEEIAPPASDFIFYLRARA